jgi:hypothetical protein
MFDDSNYLSLEDKLTAALENVEDLEAELDEIKNLGKWVPRSEPVIARDGAAFWVVNQHGRVVLAHWRLMPAGAMFCGAGLTSVTFYQPINKPEAPTC